MSVADPGFLSSAAFRAYRNEIVRALDGAQARRSFDAGEVRAAVEQCARAARASGVLPERLIIELKAVVRDVALPEMRAWYRAVLTDRVIVWAIEAYYGIDEDDGIDEDGARTE